MCDLLQMIVHVVVFPNLPLILSYAYFSTLSHFVIIRPPTSMGKIEGAQIAEIMSGASTIRCHLCNE